MLKKSSVPFIAFLQATGLIVYIGLVSTLMTSLGHIFGMTDVGNFYGSVLMLLIFITSAVISALLVLGKAGILFWDKKYKEAFTLLGYTVAWCVFYIIFLSTLMLIKL